MVFLAILFYFHYHKLNNEGMIQRQEIQKKMQKLAQNKSNTCQRPMGQNPMAAGLLVCFEKVS